MKVNHNLIRTFFRYFSIGLFLLAGLYKLRKILRQAAGEDIGDGLPPNPNDQKDSSDVEDAPQPTSSQNKKYSNN